MAVCAQKLMKVLVVCMFAVMLMMIMGAADAQNCNSVVGPIAPCLAYLQTNGMGQPPAQCCSGVKKLAGLANTSATKRQMCSCLKSQINTFPKITDNAVTNLPTKCNAALGFKISKNINCNTL